MSVLAIEMYLKYQKFKKKKIVLIQVLYTWIIVLSYSLGHLDWNHLERANVANISVVL